MKFKRHIIAILILIITSPGFGGITGSISGKLIDQSSRQGLPGAIITIVDTRLGTVADKYGYYFIGNIPPGTYDVRAKMLGYATILMTNVSIRADFNHELNFEMETQAIEGPEVVITAAKPLLTKDSPATSQSLNFADLNRKLPVDHFYQSLKTQSAVVKEQIRGGRSYDALYMIDGHSIQDPMFREISALVPLSAISDVNIQSGGFNSEYGQAMSGVVNLITKEGQEKTEGFFKIYSDNFGMKVKNDNLRRMEMSLGGPLLVSFGGPLYDLNYYVSGVTNFDDTKLANDPASDHSVAGKGNNYHYTSKLSFSLWQKIKIVCQNLTSSWQLHNPQALSLDTKEVVDHKKAGDRLNLTVIHTLNPTAFYTLNCGRDVFQRQFYNQITLSKESTLELDRRFQTSKNTYHWNDVIRERIYFLNASYYRQIASSDLIHLGTQLNFYRIYMNYLASDLFSSTVSESSDRLSGQPFIDELEVKPYTVALFAQNRIEQGSLVISLGMRFDYFNPNVVFPGHSIRAAGDTLRLASQRGKSQFQISPRCELSLPFLLNNDRLYINYGWFYQVPPLYYYYYNSRQNIQGSYSLLGNPQLAPEKTQALEIGYQKTVGAKSVLGTTGFIKRVQNLINTVSYYAGEDQPASYSRFENLDRATIQGVEIFFEQRPGDRHCSGRLSYTYCKANGTGSFPLQNYYASIQNSVSNLNTAQYPLAWDQRHTLSCHFSYLNPRLIEINLLARLNSPLPALDENFGTLGRGDWRRYIDLRIIKSFNFFKGKFSPYFEILNILNDQEPDLLHNPYYLTENHYWMSGLDSYQYESGRRIRAGLMVSFK